MKTLKRKILKILKSSAIIAAGYWLITTLFFGYTDLDSRTGIVSFRWSGIDALVSDEDFGFMMNQQYKTNLKGVDGPYIFNDVKFWVDDANQLIKESFDRNKPINVHVNNADKDTFEVTIKKSHQQEAENYEMPDKLIALSDIEGNYNALYSFLLNNKVIDQDLNWVFGSGHLVLNGDFFDRGTSVNQVLWLIYGLEKKAEKHGGKVHFINGNHEIMNLYGYTGYTDMRYIEAVSYTHLTLPTTPYV